jgi:hypothetical protein
MLGETHRQWDSHLAREGEGREGWGGGDDGMAGAGNNEVDARTMAIRSGSGVCVMRTRARSGNRQLTRFRRHE